MQQEGNSVAASPLNWVSGCADAILSRKEFSFGGGEVSGSEEIVLLQVDIDRTCGTKEALPLQMNVARYMQDKWWRAV